jgi:SAM-dependent methyltransferase
MLSASFQESSFRDPAGQLFRLNGCVLRLVRSAGIQDVTAFLHSSVGQQLLQTGRVVGTEILDAARAQAALALSQGRALAVSLHGALVLQHERIPFPSFPYEWPPEMLHTAGMLTLDLAQELLPEGLGLKDGTPYNVLFRGPRPVFVDLLSFERREPGDPAWLPYAQFVRTFLLPLLAHRHFGVPLAQSLLTRRDGLEPEEMYRWLTLWQKVRLPFLTLVSIPTWLTARRSQDDATLYRRRSLQNTEQARFIVGALLRRLRRTLQALTPLSCRRSDWSEYMASQQHYTPEQLSAKQSFVAHVLEECSPRHVLDAGCNTGYFSTLAARSGASVIAIDADPVVVGQVWRHACAEGLDIQPLVVNLTRPTPGVGWCNQECASFLERARGRFDAVFMLALIHHLLVTERIPLSHIMALAADLTRDLLVIEFIAPHDPMFRRLTRGRDALYQDLTPVLFESVCGQHFDIVRAQPLAGTSRHLYLLRKKRAQ